MSIFKEKDDVYHYSFGKGVIKNISDSFLNCDFGGLCRSFYHDGSYSADEPPTLSFTPYDLIKGGFSQERPKPEIEKGTPVFVKYGTSIYWHVGLFNGWDDKGYIGVEDLEGITRYFKEYSLENPLI